MNSITKFELEVAYDDHYTDSESVATALDRLLETALSTPGILDDYGPIEVGEFYPLPDWHEGRALLAGLLACCELNLDELEEHTLDLIHRAQAYLERPLEQQR